MPTVNRSCQAKGLKNHEPPVDMFGSDRLSCQETA